MMYHIKLQQLFHGILNVLNSRIAELNHFVTIGANQMIMLTIAERFFILRQILPELMFCNKIALHQQIQRVINSSAAHLIIL